MNEARASDKLTINQLTFLEHKIVQYHPGNLTPLLEHSLLDQGCRQFVGDNIGNEYFISSYSQIENHIKEFIYWVGEYSAITWDTRGDGSYVVVLGKALADTFDWEEFRALFDPVMQYIGVGIGSTVTGMFVAENLLTKEEKSKVDKRIEQIKASLRNIKSYVVSFRWSINLTGRKAHVKIKAKIRENGRIKEVVTDNYYDVYD